MAFAVYSMKSLTIKNIESIMEGIASEHPQINTVLKGNVWDVDLTKDVTGVYLIYEVTNIAPNGFNGIDYSMDIFPLRQRYGDKHRYQRGQRSKRV
jgi:hypothetical protein